MEVVFSEIIAENENSHQAHASDRERYLTRKDDCLFLFLSAGDRRIRSDQYIDDVAYSFNLYNLGVPT